MPVQEARHFPFVNSLYPFERSDRLGATGTSVKCCVWRPARLLTSEETDSHRVTGCLVNGLLVRDVTSSGQRALEVLVGSAELLLMIGNQSGKVPVFISTNLSSNALQTAK